MKIVSSLYPNYANLLKSYRDQVKEGERAAKALVALAKKIPKSEAKLKAMADSYLAENKTRLADIKARAKDLEIEMTAFDRDLEAFGVDPRDPASVARMRADPKMKKREAQFQRAVVALIRTLRKDVITVKEFEADWAKKKGAAKGKP